VSEPVKSTPEAAIQQLNLSYNTEQDRLLFRVGLSDNSELMVWLTLRVTKQLWALLNGETHLPSASSIQIETPPAQAIEQFKQEVQAAETLKKMDFATEYQPRPQVRNEGALLATALKLSDDGIKHLDITCLEGLNVRMNLTQELILAMCNMLQLSAKEAAWDLGIISQPLGQTQTNAAIEVDPQAKKILH
jgi:hypothetical protein